MEFYVWLEFMGIHRCNSWSVCTDLENVPLCYALLVGQSVVTKVTSLARKPAAPQTNRGIFSNWLSEGQTNGFKVPHA